MRWALGPALSTPAPISGCLMSLPCCRCVSLVPLTLPMRRASHPCLSVFVCRHGHQRRLRWAHRSGWASATRARCLPLSAWSAARPLYLSCACVCLSCACPVDVTWNRWITCTAVVLSCAPSTNGSQQPPTRPLPWPDRPPPPARPLTRLPATRPFDAGSLKARARCTLAGAIISSIGAFLVVIGIGVHDENESAAAARPTGRV